MAVGIIRHSRVEPTFSNKRQVNEDIMRHIT